MKTVELHKTALLSGELLEQRHQLEEPAVEVAFRRLATEHSGVLAASGIPQAQGVDQ